MSDDPGAELAFWVAFLALAGIYVLLLMVRP